LSAISSSLNNGVENDSFAATNAMFSTLYSELHRLAKRELARLGGRANMSITTVLHEAYLDMSERAGTLFPDQARFMGYAARVMRGLIIDHARQRSAQKRGGEFEITSLEPEMAEAPSEAKELSLISEAMDRLEKADPELAQIVDLKFFCGLCFAEIAALHKMSERTVQRKWEKARIYLRHSMGTESSF
jgi:RNA polymerase sigma factor (TIGR02999 family)